MPGVHPARGRGRAGDPRLALAGTDGRVNDDVTDQPGGPANGIDSDLRILVVNAGSSSLKLRVLDDADGVVASIDLPATRGTTDAGAIETALGTLGPIRAVGHRIVHGGTRYSGPVRLDAAVEANLRALTDLAPLHQPKSMAALAAVQAVLPDVPAVACFDTAFHASMPAAATTYAIPPEWRKRWALRKYGFHGLSHAYAARRAAEIVGRPVEDLRIVTCHLGAGASLAAVRDGRSIDTTMGFTPLDGLVMATRSGSIDPGLVLWLADHAGMPTEELAATLEHRSGLLGLAGTADMRAILAAEAAGDEAAILAIGVYLHRLRASIAAMVAALGGLDVLVFTGGVGEHAPSIRVRVAVDLAYLGIVVDPTANDGAEVDADIGAPEARVRTLVVTAREDLEIAREVRAVLRLG
jgi:acetate kinase